MHYTWQAFTRGISIKHVKSSGRRFPEKGCILEHRICRFPKMILRDRCNTSDDLDGVENRKAPWYGGRQLCTQLAMFEGGLAELLRF